ncbi:MAG: TolC family protein [Betaproteobacteria bacterium]|nr:TolC family protein [Betaproteobacteria bacterium]
MKIKTILFIITILLTGCATYDSKPLPEQPLWPDNIHRLEVPVLTLSTESESQHFIFNPNDGLDVVEVAAMAVANNPNLKVARDVAGVTKAQAFQAGLLPDPTLLIYPQLPINGGNGTSSVASEYGVFYNISALITHSSLAKSSKSTEQKADLDLLWQEWLVLSQAQILFEKICTNEKILQWLKEKESILKNIDQAQQEALLKKDLDLSVTSINTLLYKEVSKQRLDLERTNTQDRHLLNQMLGLAPSTELQLVNNLTLPELSSAKVQKQLKQVTHLRPDLLALQKGYDAQDYRLREAILAQFPTINFGFARLRDNGAVEYNGFDLSISLPIFNRNQGNVAIAKATRQQLFDEYQIRINSIYSEVSQLTHDTTILKQQVSLMTESMATLSGLSRSGRIAFQNQDMDLFSYSQLRINEIDKKIELERTQQLLVEQTIQLSMLIGEPLSNWVKK